MDTLGLYIKEALQDKGKIYLPRIGMFKTERIPAFFNDLKQCFMPPLQSIVLTDQQASGDLLIQFIAEKENIDLEESHIRVEKLISELETNLKEKEEITFKGFGKLKKVENRYEFTYFQPSLEGTFNDFEPIAEAEIITPIEEKINVANHAINLNDDKALEPIEELVSTEENTEEESNSRKWLWAVLTLVVFASVAGFWLLNPDFNFANLTKTTETIANNQATEQTTTEAEAPLQSTDLSPQPQLSESTEQVILPPASESSESIVKEAQGRFEVIIAAFHTMEEAEAYVNRTNAKGYNVYIIKNNNPGNLNKISYGSFQTAPEADQALAKVREELTKEAWVFASKK